MDDITENNVPTSSKEKSGKLLKTARVLLFVALIGGLIGFIPSAFLSGVFFKSTVIFLGVITAFVLVVYLSLKSNEIFVPNNLLFYTLPALPIAYLISAIASPSWSTSAVGNGFEVGTLAFITAMSLVVYVTVVILRQKKFVSMFQFFILLSAALLFVVQLLLIISPSTFGLSKILSTSISNFIGNLNDLGVFFGATLILALSFVELAKTGKISKIIAYVTMAVSLFMLAFAGFTHLWIVVGLLTLGLFISRYIASDAKASNQDKFANPSFIVTVIAVIFIIFGSSISNQLYSTLNVSGSELFPPTISQTLPVISESFKDNALLGVGPNRFSSEWVKHKPDEINASVLWSVDYNYGHSFFLTSIVTTGLLGVLAFLSVFASLLFMGYRYVLRKKNDAMSYLTFSSFALAVYLWITLFIHVPSSGVIMLVFMSTGMFLVSLYVSGSLKEKVYKLDSKPNASLAIVLVMVLFMIAGVAFDAQVLFKAHASTLYQKARVELSTGNFDEARNHMEKAITYGGNDLYYRGLSEIYLRELQVRAPELTTNQTEEKAQISRDLSRKASQAARQSQLTDKSNYQNYMSIGKVLQVFVSPQNDEAYITAGATFEKALQLSPKNPSILLALANLEIVRGDQEKAVDYLTRALELKPNYTQARFMWAQMQVSQGDISSAIDVMTDAATISPRDAGVQFQLGLLKFENSDFAGAAGNFERVLEMIPQHANARYYLALSLAEIDRVDEAVSLLEQIKATNPSNTLLDSTIESLTREEPEVVDASIEDLEDLPIDEDLSEDQVGAEDEEGDEESEG